MSNSSININLLLWTAIAFNEDLDEAEGDNPTLANEDPYGKGWIVKIEMSDPSELDGLMDAASYQAEISS